MMEVDSGPSKTNSKIHNTQKNILNVYIYTIREIARNSSKIWSGF